MKMLTNGLQKKHNFTIINLIPQIIIYWSFIKLWFVFCLYAMEIFADLQWLNLFLKI